MKRNLPFQFDHGSTDSSTWHLPEGALVRLGRGDVNDIAFTPDGRYLAVTSHFGLWWYDVSTRAVLTLWEAGTAPYPVAISNCGTWVAIGGGHARHIGIWEVSSGTCLATLTRAENERVDLLVFSPDRKHIAVSGQWRYEKEFFSIEIYSLPEALQASGTPVHLKSDHIYAGAFQPVFSSDSRLLAFAAPTGAPLPFHPGGYPIQDPNRGLRAHHIAICDVSTGQHITTLSGLNDVGSICFSPCGQFLAAAADFGGPVHEWKIPENLSPDASEWQLHNVYPEVDDENVSFSGDICYSPEGSLITFDISDAHDTFIARRLDQNETDNQPPQRERLTFSVDFAVDVWKIGEERVTYVQRGHGLPAGQLQFSQDGKTLHESCRWDGVCSWDLAHPDQPLLIFKPLGRSSEPGGERYLSLDTSPDGKHFVTSGDENSVRLWELGIDTPIASFPIQAEAYSGAFSPTSNLLACRDKAGKIYVWDIATGEMYDTYMSEDGSGYNDLTFSSDGTYLICHSGQIYDVDQRKTLDVFLSDDGFNFLGFPPDSSQIWCDWSGSGWGNYDSIDLWDMLRDEEVMSIPKPEWWQAKNIDAFVLSTCGQYLACSPDTWALEGYICVWDIRKGTEPIVTFKVKEGISSLTFSLDNTLLASAGTSGAILLWDMKPYL